MLRNPDLPHYQPSATINCLVQAMRTPDPVIARNLFLEARARVLQGAVYLGAWTKNDRVACESHKLTLRETNRLYQDYDRIAFEAQRLADAEGRAAAAAHADLHKGRHRPVTASQEDYLPPLEGPEEATPEQRDEAAAILEFQNLEAERGTLDCISRFFKDLNTLEISPQLRNRPERLENLAKELVDGIPAEVLDGVADSMADMHPLNFGTLGGTVRGGDTDSSGLRPPSLQAEKAETVRGEEACGASRLEPHGSAARPFDRLRVNGDSARLTTPGPFSPADLSPQFGGTAKAKPEQGGLRDGGTASPGLREASKGVERPGEKPEPFLAPETFHATAARLDRSDSVTSMEYWSPELATEPDPFDADHRERAARLRAEMEAEGT